VETRLYTSSGLAAEFLGVSKWTVQRMIRRGELPGVRLGSGHWRIPVNCLLDEDELALGPLGPKRRGSHRRRRRRAARHRRASTAVRKPTPGSDA
jgi:excisionase family DNA binding protein